MKKTAKIILLAIAALTVIMIIAALTMLKAVRGDALLYMDSALGNIYAVSYRWVCLASIALVLFWIIFVYTRRAAIKEFMLKFTPKRNRKSAEKGIDPTAPVAANRFCANCGKQIGDGNKFCQFCGTPVG